MPTHYRIIYCLSARHIFIFYRNISVYGVELLLPKATAWGSYYEPQASNKVPGYPQAIFDCVSGWGSYFSNGFSVS